MATPHGICRCFGVAILNVDADDHADAAAGLEDEIVCAGLQFFPVLRVGDFDEKPRQRQRPDGVAGIGGPVDGGTFELDSGGSARLNLRDQLSAHRRGRETPILVTELVGNSSTKTSWTRVTIVQSSRFLRDR